MTCFELSKRELDKWIKAMIRDHDIYAPVKREGVTNFEKVSDSKEIVLHEHSYLPLKRFFFRPKEVLFEFKGNTLTEPKIKIRKRVILGAKRCDLNSILRQDMMFLNENNDFHYRQLRENTLLIGYQCKSAFDKYCFCESMDLEECQDLMIYDRGPTFLVEATSEKGQVFAREFKKFLKHGRRLTGKPHHQGASHADGAPPGPYSLDQCQRRFFARLAAHGSQHPPVDML